MKRGISIIICCYNSEKRLPETLTHLLAQKNTAFNWEIIVVNNASSDSTSGIAEKILSEKFSSEKFKIVQEQEPGLSSARRKGYLTSQYNLLMFCDDDNWMEENYLQLAFDTLDKNQRIGILGGKGEPVFESTKPEWFEKYQLNFAVGSQTNSAGEITKVETVYGAGFIVRREIFETLDEIHFESLLSDRKGNQLMSGGDTELCIVTKYLGYDVCYSTQLRFKHLMTSGRMNWEYLKKLYYGFGRSRVYTHAYLQMETSNQIPGKNLRLPLWLDKYVHHAKELKLFLPQIIFKLNEDGNEEVLKYLALRGELYELLTLKNNYVNVFEKILAMKNRIVELKK